MPQGMMIGVPEGGRISGKGSRGSGVRIVGVGVGVDSVVSGGVKVSFLSVTSGVNVVSKLCSEDDEFVEGPGLSLELLTGERNLHPSR